MRIRTPFIGTALSLTALTVQADDVKLGALAAVTGPIPELVAVMVDAEQLAVAQINAQGGVLGGRLSLVIADSQCDAKAAVDAATKLVNVDQVPAIVGAICSGGTIGAAQAVTIPAGVVSVSPSATSPAITDLEDNDLVFRAAPSDSYQGVELAELARGMGYVRLAMTMANDDYNVGLANVFKEAFVAAGGEIVAEQMHEPNKPSYRSQLATLAASGAEALAMFAYYDGSGLTILRQSLENGYFTRFIGADGMVNQSVIDEIGAETLAGNAVFTTSATDEGSPSYAAFAEAFAEAGGDPLAPYAAHSYDATFVLALAIQKAGTTDRAAIGPALRAVASAPGEVIRPGEWAKALDLIAAGTDINYEGAATNLDFDANGDVQGFYSKNTVTADGKFKIESIE
ncbi:MAG: ABC transporter substrate-binding protein [Paracoccaceae bacterium]